MSHTYETAQLKQFKYKYIRDLLSTVNIPEKYERTLEKIRCNADTSFENNHFHISLLDKFHLLNQLFKYFFKEKKNRSFV